MTIQHAVPRAEQDAAPPPRPAMTLVPASYATLAGWHDDDHARAFAAFRASAEAVIGRCSLAGDAHARRLAEICRMALARPAGRTSRAAARAFFERLLVPHKVVHAAPHGLLTGYFEPVLEGSREPTDRFRVPLHRRPPDLENVVAESERARTGVALTHLRRTPAGLEPYPTRAQIEAGALAGRGLELVWLADPVDAFLAQVQGSLRVRLPDGAQIGLTYDGKNGHPYTSIGRVLIERGAIAATAMSLDTLAAWLRADMARGRAAMHHNASYVFFRETGSAEGAADAGALGALGTPLVAGRSLAVDTTFHALGSPIWVDAPDLRHGSSGSGKPLRRLMIAHDVGSAIRGPERGDIYFGSGDRAGGRAGITRHAGTFHVLLPRTSPSRLRGRR